MCILISMLTPQVFVCPVFAEEAADADDESTEVSTVSGSADMYMPSETIGDVEAPLITAEGAILMDADNGVILYQKNMDTPYFPASITKIMTCLLAVENCSLS